MFHEKHNLSDSTGDSYYFNTILKKVHFWEAEESIATVMRCAIWYQTRRNGVQMVGQNAVLPS